MYYGDQSLIVLVDHTKEILKELEIIGHNYNIETVNKIVYIIGIVDDENELQTVVDIAKNTRGVIKVINYVKVQS